MDFVHDLSVENLHRTFGVQSCTVSINVVHCGGKAVDIRAIGRYHFEAKACVTLTLV